MLLASAAFPDARSLLATFSRRQGGPGSVVLVPGTGAEGATAGDFQADQLLVKPCSAKALRQTVRPYLETSPAPEDALQKGSRQFSSADIFGDVLAEVEAEARREKKARRARTRRTRSQTEDIEHKLEETLSGVIPVGGRRKRTAVAGSPADASPAVPQPGDRTSPATEIQNLLDKTLSSLELAPGRSARRRQPAGNLRILQWSHKKIRKLPSRKIGPPNLQPFRESRPPRHRRYWTPGHPIFRLRARKQSRRRSARARMQTC